MDILKFLKLLKRLRMFFLYTFFRDQWEKKRPTISLLIPFSTKSRTRKRTFKWLQTYWKNELPYAEIIVGRSNSKPFNKNEALNDAARKAHGKVLVLLDADTYMEGKVLQECADEIIEELEFGNHLWFVPYRHLFRLTKQATRRILRSDPRDPLRLPSPPNPEDVMGDGQESPYGHRYGAMVMVFPREALDVLGCFDERFAGWGGEDVALLRALDTLWGKHKTTENDVLHLWHPMIGDTYRTRKWKNQEHPESNANLAMRYHKASRNPSKMRKLVDEACKPEFPVDF
jgi:hypothetical protein